MLEQLIEQTKDRHSKQAISSEAYSEWRNSTVTKRLFEDLELSVIDSYQNWLPDEPDLAFGMAKLREGGSMMVEQVLDWAPNGVEGPNDE